MRYYLPLAALLLAALSAHAAPVELLNVSYDPTREFYGEYNRLFEADWKRRTGQDILVKLSNGGSGTQARAVMQGLRADVVTLALGYDIDAIATRAHLLPDNWQSAFPSNSSPYTSTIVFLVRKGNPKQIHDWDDLIKGDVKIITPNPKTSGGARWNYLAAWGYALKKNNGNEDAAKAFVAQLYRHVPVLDTGARGATTTFIERDIGDVLIAWENEAWLSRTLGDFETIIPSVSILAEPPVAVVEKNATRKGTLDAANFYLRDLYSHDAQELIAKYHFRPTDPDVMKEHAADFPTLNLLTIRDFGGWQTAQAKHFAEGGTFDQIYEMK